MVNLTHLPSTESNYQNVDFYLVFPFLTLSKHSLHAKIQSASSIYLIRYNILKSLTQIEQNFCRT